MGRGEGEEEGGGGRRGLSKATRGRSNEQGEQEGDRNARVAPRGNTGVNASAQSIKKKNTKLKFTKNKV